MRRPERPGLGAIAFGLCSLWALAAAAAAAETRDEFRVCHDGTDLGAHVVTARMEDGRRVVQTQVDLSVFFGAWRFESRQTEVWEGDRLVAFTSQTDDDGEWHDIRAEPAGDGLLMRGHEHETALPADAAPENFWHPFLRGRSLLFETKKGRPKTVAVAADGAEVLTIDRRKVPAKRYAVTGDLERRLWYDEDDRLLRIALLNKGRSFLITRGRCPD